MKTTLDQSIVLTPLPPSPPLLLNHDQAQHDRTDVSMHTYSTDSTHCPGTRLTLGQRDRRWSSLKPALEQCVVSVWYANCQQYIIP